jgi:cytochrome c
MSNPKPRPLHRQRLTMLAPALALTMVMATSAAAQSPLLQSQAAGLELAKRNCAQCHAIAATGDSPLKGAPKFRDFSENIDMDQLANALRNGLLTHHPAMPELRLSPREIEQLGAYLRDVQTRKDVRAADHTARG